MLYLSCHLSVCPLFNCKSVLSVCNNIIQFWRHNFIWSIFIFLYFKKLHYCKIVCVIFNRLRMKLEYCNFFCSFAYRRCNGNTEILLFIEKLLTSVFSWNFIELREPPYWAEYSKTRLIIHTVCLSKYFDLAIAGVIGLNVITMAMEFYMMPEVRFLEHGLIPQKKNY